MRITNITHEDWGMTIDVDPENLSIFRKAYVFRDDEKNKRLTPCLERMGKTKLKGKDFKIIKQKDKDKLIKDLTQEETDIILQDWSGLMTVCLIKKPE